jgi:hypothetical protein
VSGPRPGEDGGQVLRRGAGCAGAAAVSLSLALLTAREPASPWRSVVIAAALTGWGLLFGAALSAVVAAARIGVRTLAERRLAGTARRGPGSGRRRAAVRTRPGGMARRPVSRAVARLGGGTATAEVCCAWCEHPVGFDADGWLRCLRCDPPGPDDYWRTDDAWAGPSAEEAAYPVYDAASDVAPDKDQWRIPGMWDEPAAREPDAEVWSSPGAWAEAAALESDPELWSIPGTWAEPAAADLAASVPGLDLWDIPGTQIGPQIGPHIRPQIGRQIGAQSAGQAGGPSVTAWPTDVPGSATVYRICFDDGGGLPSPPDRPDDAAERPDPGIARPLSPS